MFEHHTDNELLDAERHCKIQAARFQGLVISDAYVEAADRLWVEYKHRWTVNQSLAQLDATLENITAGVSD